MAPAHVFWRAAVGAETAMKHGTKDKAANEGAVGDSAWGRVIGIVGGLGPYAHIELERLILAAAMVPLLCTDACAANKHWIDPASKWTRTEVGPPNGKLLICGGEGKKSMLTLFLKLAGGPNVPIVVIPTATDGKCDETNPGVTILRSYGATSVTVLHTTDPKVADSESFVAPLKTAKGVWIPGGRQWRLADAYLHTRTHRELFALLDRGGVIGGSSAGASIVASYLVRGDPKTNRILMAPGHEEGFGFVRHTAIDQHVLARGRESGLVKILEKHPELLGIGIDERTAIVVTGDQFEVFGESKVAVYDARRLGWPKESSHIFLSAGDRYDLKSRVKP